MFPGKCCTATVVPRSAEADFCEPGSQISVASNAFTDCGLACPSLSSRHSQGYVEPVHQFEIKSKFQTLCFKRIINVIGHSLPLSVVDLSKLVHVFMFTGCVRRADWPWCWCRHYRLVTGSDGKSGAPTGSLYWVNSLDV